MILYVYVYIKLEDSETRILWLTKYFRLHCPLYEKYYKFAINKVEKESRTIMLSEKWLNLCKKY